MYYQFDFQGWSKSSLITHRESILSETPLIYFTPVVSQYTSDFMLVHLYCGFKYTFKVAERPH